MIEPYSSIPYVALDGLSEEEWLAYRRTGVGGSDVKILMDLSPYQSILGLCQEKWRGVPKAEIDRLVQLRKENQASLPVEESEWGIQVDIKDGDYNLPAALGHGAEKAAGEYLSSRFGIPVYKPKWMYQHPNYPFMLFNPDFIALWPDPETGELIPAVVEVKRESFHKLDDWRNAPPAGHVWQCRHGMSVMNMSMSILIGMMDNNEGGVCIYTIPRDYGLESKMIGIERSFWIDYVTKKVLPVPNRFSESAKRDLAFLASQHFYEKAELEQNSAISCLARQYEALYTEKKVLIEELETVKQNLSVHMIGKGKTDCENLRMQWQKRKNRSMDYEAFRLFDPAGYAHFVKETESTSFGVRVRESKIESAEKAA